LHRLALERDQALEHYRKAAGVLAPVAGEFIAQFRAIVAELESPRS